MASSNIGEVCGELIERAAEALAHRIEHADEGLARASITSAFPLSEGELSELKGALERRFGKKIEATVSIDQSLIGGAKIAVGDTVIDASVKGELQAMANHLRT